MEKLDNTRERLHNTGDKLLDMVFPPSLYCICCGNIIDYTRTYHLCDHCIRHIKWDPGPPEIVDLEGTRFPALRCVEYGLYERSLIFSLKYNGNKFVARDIAEMMVDKLDLVDVSFDVCVPIPLFEKKKKSRGFNQAELLAKYMAQIRNRRDGRGSMTSRYGRGSMASRYGRGRETVEVAPEALVRLRDTRPMRGLNPAQRAANIRGSIGPGKARDLEKIKGKRVLLIDDFYTTGATAKECVRVLSEAGPSQITFMAFAAR